jgi:hypothetical protein
LRDIRAAILSGRLIALTAVIGSGNGGVCAPSLNKKAG